MHQMVRLFRRIGSHVRHPRATVSVCDDFDSGCDLLLVGKRKEWSENLKRDYTIRRCEPASGGNFQHILGNVMTETELSRFKE
jgi:hypothetical protein